MKQDGLTLNHRAPGARGPSFGTGVHGSDNARMNRLAHLEKRVDAIDGRLGRIERDVDTLKSDVNALKGDVNTLKGDVNTLKGDVSTLKGDVNTLKGDVNTLKSDVNTLKGDVSAVKTTLASIDSKLDIGSIRASVERAHTDIYKWIVSIIAVIGAIYFGLQRLPPAAFPQVYSYPPSPAQAVPAPLAPGVPPASR